MQEALDQLQKQVALPQPYMMNQVEKDDLLKQVFKESPFPPNNLQVAVAQTAAFGLGKYPRQIWQVGAGQGKSRISAAIPVFLRLAKTPVKRIFIVFVTPEI